MKGKYRSHPKTCLCIFSPIAFTSILFIYDSKVAQECGATPNWRIIIHFIFPNAFLLPHCHLTLNPHHWSFRDSRRGCAGSWNHYQSNGWLSRQKWWVRTVWCSTACHGCVCRWCNGEFQPWTRWSNFIFCSCLCGYAVMILCAVTAASQYSFFCWLSMPGWRIPWQPLLRAGGSRVMGQKQRKTVFCMSAAVCAPWGASSWRWIHTMAAADEISFGKANNRESLMRIVNLSFQNASTTYSDLEMLSLPSRHPAWRLSLHQGDKLPCAELQSGKTCCKAHFWS